MFSPNRAWHNRPNRTEKCTQTLWRSLPFAVRLQLIGMSTDPLLLHATKTSNRCLTSSKVLLHRVSTCSQSRSGGIVLPGFRILKSVYQGEHLIHHETQGGFCNLSVVAPTLTFSQSKITAAFLEYDLYAPASFQKFKGSDEFMEVSVVSNTFQWVLRPYLMMKMRMGCSPGFA